MIVKMQRNQYYIITIALKFDVQYTYFGAKGRTINYLQS